MASDYSGVAALLGNLNRIVIADARDSNAAVVLRYCIFTAICRGTKPSIVLKTNPVANQASRIRSYFSRAALSKPEQYPQQIDPKEYSQPDK